MTALELGLWIVLGIGVQLAWVLGRAFWRQWRYLRSLRGEMALLAGNMLPAEAPEASPPLWAGERLLRVERKVIEDAAQEVCSLYLVPEDGQPLPVFRPGQFLILNLELPRPAEPGRAVVRCYSLSDEPRSDYYRISVKRAPAPPNTQHPPGLGSSLLHDQLAVGALLRARAPAGHFYLESTETPVVLIGGGIGITPLLSMINWMARYQPQRECWLFYGVRHGRELVQHEHLQALAQRHPSFQVRIVISQPLPDDDLERPHWLRGRVDIQCLRLQLPLKPFHFYLCGPPPLVHTLVPALEDWGVPSGRIHYEAFGPASMPRRTTPVADQSLDAAPDAAITVTFARSGQQRVWRPAQGTLLECAEAQGVAVPSGCRAGGCGTCQTTILSGEVTYLQAPEYDPQPGSCLLCVSVPKNHLTLEV